MGKVEQLFYHFTSNGSKNIQILVMLEKTYTGPTYVIFNLQQG